LSFSSYAPYRGGDLLRVREGHVVGIGFLGHDLEVQLDVVQRLQVLIVLL
jgi:hypothetical protein